MKLPIYPFERENIISVVILEFIGVNEPLRLHRSVLFKKQPDRYRSARLKIIRFSEQGINRDCCRAIAKQYLTQIAIQPHTLFNIIAIMRKSVAFFFSYNAVFKLMRDSMDFQMSFSRMILPDDVLLKAFL